jgi:ABC-type branched-subunit amino acid transport system substrate-binding protein
MQVATCRDFLTPASRQQSIATCAVLNLAVLLPTSNSWAEGRASAGAISLAVADANKKFPVKVSFVWEAVDCESNLAVAAISRIIQGNVVDAVIGPDCEASCESLAYLTAELDLPQISYSCRSDLLSDKSKYPTVASHLHPRPASARLHCSCCLWMPRCRLSLSLHSSFESVA